jgi:hypothetical protein
MFFGERAMKLRWTHLLPIVVFAASLIGISCAGAGGDGTIDGGTTGDGPLGCPLNAFSPNYLEEVDPSTGDLNGVHWWDHFPIRVFFTTHPKLQGLNLSDVAMAGFNAWSEVSGITMATEVGSESQADLVVTFENIPNEPGSGDVLGQTSWTYSPSTFETFSAEMTLRTWTGMTADEVANGFRRTAQHEFGHAIFLSGHSPFSQDTMYPFGPTSVYTALTERDKNSLASAYCGSFGNRVRSRAPVEVVLTRTMSSYKK